MKKLILFIFVLFLISPVLAQEELLLQINVFDDGSALIIGSATINPEIEDIEYEEGTLYGYTQHLTNKKGATWTFSLEIEQDFSNSYVKVILPENSKLGLISSSLDSFISIENKDIIIEFVGKEKVDIEFNYELETSQEKKLDFIYVVGIIVTIIILGIGIWSFLKKKKKNPEKEKEKKERKQKKRAKENPLKPVMNTLNEREKKIINELLEHKKLKQNQLQHLTKIPKVSLSRHLVNLENKNLIIKKSLGKTNIISINKDFDKKQEKQES